MPITYTLELFWEFRLTSFVPFLKASPLRIHRYLLNDTYLENSTHHDTVEEVQHAVCKIATEEIQASANASITRQLKGVCSTKAMNSKLDEVQRIILTEIEIFKLMLISAGYTTPRPTPTLPIQIKSSNTEDYDYTYYFDNATNLNSVKNLEYGNKTQIKDNYLKAPNNPKTQSKNKTKVYVRETEVREINETIQKTDMGKAFIYVWRIPDIETVLKEDIELTSPIIDYLGSTIFIKLSTRYLGTNYVSLELLTPDKFTKAFRFVIMHKKAKNDFNSPLLGITKPPARLFRITKGKVQSLIFSGALLIKLLVYLDL
ncbi:hypothetical protein Trydic_g13135 [Trypoxylus dichotomus]